MTGMNGGKADASGIDGKYMMLVGGLMVVIIAMLAILWQKERRSRLLAEKNLAETRLLFEQRQQALAQMLVSEGAMRQPPVDRKYLVPELVEFRGKVRPVFYVTPEAGRAIGFADGDLVDISPAPPGAASRPLQQPRDD